MWQCLPAIYDNRLWLVNVVLEFSVVILHVFLSSPDIMYAASCPFVTTQPIPFLSLAEYQIYLRFTDFFLSPINFYISTFFSETKLGRDVHWMVLYTGDVCFDWNSTKADTSCQNDGGFLFVEHLNNFDDFVYLCSWLNSLYVQLYANMFCTLFKT